MYECSRKNISLYRAKRRALSLFKKGGRTRHAAAVVLSDQVGIVLGVYGVVVTQLYHLLERVVDEDEADESREALLCEAREVLHQEAGVRGDQHQTEQARPQADPQPELQVVEPVVSEQRGQKRIFNE